MEEEKQEQDGRTDIFKFEIFCSRFLSLSPYEFCFLVFVSLTV